MTARTARRGAQALALTVDIGNSVTNFGLAEGEELKETWSVTTPENLTADEALMCVSSYLQVRCDGAEVGDAIVSSVVPSLTDAWIEANGMPLRPGVKEILAALKEIGLEAALEQSGRPWRRSRGGLRGGKAPVRVPAYRGGFRHGHEFGSYR